MSDGLGEQLRRELAKLGQEAREHSLNEFDARTLCRASLLPHWTKDLADDLGLTRSEGFADLLERLDRAGLVERGIDSAGAGAPRESFWIRARLRREVGDHLRACLGDALPAEYDELCGLVTAHRPSDARLRRWLEVRDFHADPSGRKLLDRVDAQLDADDLPGAAETVATARLVADILGGPIEGAVKRAQWRLDRAYRTTDDLEHLCGYFRRPDLESAIHRLISAEVPVPGVTEEAGANAGHRRGIRTWKDIEREPVEPWALHLMGDAGVGKTMVLRYLASGRLAEDFGLTPFPVARVDFDHLDPRYPDQRPVELLVALTDQLLGFASSRAAERYHRRVHDAADALYEELARPEPDRQRAKSLVAGAVVRFARLVEELGGRVVLVLDTCEELSKLYAPGVSAPAIDRTFELLEQLHERVPRVRVVFAGRRWLVPPDSVAHGGPNLLPRSYMDVLRVSGFTAAEADRFLDAREVPGTLRAAVLARSAMGGGDRYNPFELESYSAWARSDPELVAADLLLATGDPYVERRIVARIQDSDVLAALPVAAALGRFDRSLITPALRRTGADPGAAFDGLSAQEWISVVRLGADGRPLVLEVDEHLRDRLRKVVASRGIGLPLDERRLGQDAATVVLSGQRPSEVAAETVEAAMRLLPAGEAVELWNELERRVTEHDDWGWALQVSSRVGALEATRSGPSALAAVLATQAASRVHTGQRTGLVDVWNAVLRVARRHPSQHVGEVLSLRAELGRVAAGYPIGPKDWRNLVERVGRQQELAGSLLAAAEGLSAALSPELVLSLGATLDRLRDVQVPAIAAYAGVLAEGVRLRLRLAAAAASTSGQPAGLLEDAPEPAPITDWVAPRGLLDRARLIRVLDALHGGPPLDERVWRTWKREALPRCTSDVDANRLVAATIDYELCHRVLPVDDLPPHIPHQAWEAIPWLHHGLGRPLAVAVADAFSASGDFAAAADMLNRHRSEAVVGGSDARTVESCDLALLRLCRRHRRSDLAPVLRLAYEGSPRVRDEAWLVQVLLDGQVPDRTQLSEYGYWRCAPDSAPPHPDWQPADHLDLWETEVLATDEFTGALPDEPRARGVVALLVGEVRASADPERGARLLRLASEEFTAAGDSASAAHAALLARQAKSHVQDVPAASAESFERTGVTAAPKPSFLARWRDLVVVDTSVVGVVAAGWMAVLAVLFKFLPQWVWVGALIPLAAALAVGLIWTGVRPDDVFSPVDLVRVRRDSRQRFVVRTDATVLVSELDGVRPSRRALAINVSRWRARGRYAVRDNAQWAHTVVVLGPDDGYRLKHAMLDVPARAAPHTARNPRHLLGLDIERDLQAEDWERRLGELVHFAGKNRQLDKLVRIARGRHRLGHPVGTTPLVFRMHDPRQGVADDRAPDLAVFKGPGHLEPSAGERPRHSGLVHLVGAPVATTAGTHFRVGGSMERHARVAAREELVDLDHVTAHFLVLQAEPVDVEARPLDEARAEFTRCAMAAVDAGVGTVLIVPPLEDLEARAVAQRIWKTADGRPSTREVLLLLADLQEMVGDVARYDLVLFRRRIDPQENG
ncbi:hypothetical protein [Kutzneria sp. NPDC052558]|uniref:hypothetical protein n=1 Tax=Kutzneria sp. NPDC052558 TaxID=3364121 RepID=UPI0037CC1CE6